MVSDEKRGLTDKVLDGGKSIFGKGKNIAKGVGADGPTEMFVVSFVGESKADEVLEALRQLNDQRLLALGDAAVIRRGSDGDIDIEETADMDTKEGAIAGAAAGGLLGLLTGKGMVGGALLGAGGGALAAHGLDLGLDDDVLRSVGEKLEPGSSAIVATVEFVNVDASMEALDRFEGGTILQATLSPDIVDQLSAAVED
jgi:uncharacterized membrane protein